VGRRKDGEGVGVIGNLKEDRQKDMEMYYVRIYIYEHILILLLRFQYYFDIGKHQVIEAANDVRKEGA
jgi:hypothetical protein